MLSDNNNIHVFSIFQKVSTEHFYALKGGNIVVVTTICPFFCVSIYCQRRVILSVNSCFTGVYIYVYISEAPHISLYESRVLVASGDTAILFCGADGIPPPEIHWYKGEIEVKF